MDGFDGLDGTGLEAPEATPTTPQRPTQHLDSGPNQGRSQPRAIHALRLPWGRVVPSNPNHKSIRTARRLARRQKSSSATHITPRALQAKQASPCTHTSTQSLHPHPHAQVVTDRSMNGKRGALLLSLLGKHPTHSAAFLAAASASRPSCFFHPATATSAAAATALRVAPLSALAVGTLSFSSLSRAVTASVRSPFLHVGGFHSSCQCARLRTKRRGEGKKGYRAHPDPSRLSSIPSSHTTPIHLFRTRSPQLAAAAAPPPARLPPAPAASFRA